MCKLYLLIFLYCLGTLLLIFVDILGGEVLLESVVEPFILIRKTLRIFYVKITLNVTMKKIG